MSSRNSSAASFPRDRLRRNALAIWNAALAAADARHAVTRILRTNPIPAQKYDRIFMVAVGKAAASMAAAVQQNLGHRLTDGIVVTKHGHATEHLPGLTTFEAGHPVPDAQGVAAAASVESLLRELNAQDLLIAAISGGASALLPAPVAPLTLLHKQRTTDLLLRAGADIFELNTVRKHLSRFKGGQLAALAWPATVTSLLLSDVIGDDYSVIGSGLTAPDPSTFNEALHVFAKYKLSAKIPAPVLRHLQSGATGALPETPKPRSPLFKNVTNTIVASNRMALDAAARHAHTLGYNPLILSSSFQGETREVARACAAILREIVASGNPVRRPTCLLAGGETTVSVKGSGKGGRNQEWALASALAIEGLPRCLVLSGGSDGTDGPTDAAGAIATGDTLSRARALQLDPSGHLDNNNAYPFFDALEDLVRTGPTGTNVMDIAIYLAR